MQKLLFLLLAVACCLPGVHAQTTADTSRHTLTLGGSVDAYYANHSTDNGGDLIPYLSAGPRDNAFGLNIAQLSLDYQGPRMRANFTYQVGDIPTSSWSPVYTQVQKAHAGVNLGGTWWLDAGFFTTHLGNESILPKNKYLSSTAYLSWNEPFYQSGLRLSYRANEQWSFQGWLVNGYNSFVDNNDAKSVGVSVTYDVDDNTSLIYNNLLGNEGGTEGSPDQQFRVFHNVYWTQHWSDRFLTILNLDAATQTNSQLGDPDATATMLGGFLTLDYALADRWNLTGRLEVYDDPSGFISGLVPTANLNGETGLQLTGITTSLQYRPAPEAYLRAETRLGRQADDLGLFTRDGERVDTRVEFMVSCGVAFGRGVGWD